jgi:hypothetical protein
MKRSKTLTGKDTTPLTTPLTSHVALGVSHMLHFSKEVNMPTTKPRINIILEEPLYKTVEELADRDGVSLSLKARDLIREALEIQEDVALTSFADAREKTFRKSKALKHEKVW